MTFSDPHSYVDTSQGEIEHIKFNIKVDFEKQVLNLKAIYRMDKPVNGSLFLDTRDIDLHRIYTDDGDIAWEKDMQDSILGERLHLKNLKDVSEFTIELITSSNASALQWMTPAQTTGGEHPFLYTQCQALHARSIFPCQDSPSIRFTYEAEVDVPDPLIAVMGAARVEAGSGYRFEMRQPIPSYLFALAAGNLSFKEIGPRTGIYAEPELIEASAWEFAENEQKLIEAEKLLGPYLWDRYDVLILPRSFPYGAMENPRLTFCSGVFITGDRTWTFVITHELAHAWTGNLITNATWEDFWLNEGWTTYTETRISEILEGEEYGQLIDTAGYLDLLEEMKRFGIDSDITCLKYSQKGLNPDEIFSGIPYIKGSYFIKLLERFVGRERFDAFIQKYISAHKFQSLTTEAFVTFLKQELPDAVEKTDLDEWLYKPGLPKDAPQFQSKLYDDLVIVADSLKKGSLPMEDQIAGWIPAQRFYFFRMLPEVLSIEDCRSLEKIFELKDNRDFGLSYQYYARAIQSGYQDVLPEIEEITGNIGRSYVIGGIFRAMVKTEWSRPLARPLFERYREKHHPITVARIESILKDADL
ncbi:MAG TPA: leukotriene A4 hydrolase C-terminal domain-containing protein [Anaerolineales bacterium]|nr:leukotriene A4 hydrolase C-terminal domain-containing protein [Anaerolineales bacterium]